MSATSSANLPVGRSQGVGEDTSRRGGGRQSWSFTALGRIVSVAAVGWLALVCSLFAQGRAYRIEPSADSRFALEVYKTGLMKGKKHLFVFERYQGKLEFDPQNPAQSQVELTIRSDSLVAKDDWVSAKDLEKIKDEALNNKLAVKQYPEMKFRSRGIRAAGGERRYAVAGDLTIRNVTRPVVVSGSLTDGPEGSLLFEGEATVKMTDYNMKPPSAALGLIGTQDEMTLSFRLRAVPVAGGGQGVASGSTQPSE